MREQKTPMKRQQRRPKAAEAILVTVTRHKSKIQQSGNHTGNHTRFKNVFETVMFVVESRFLNPESYLGSGGPILISFQLKSCSKSLSAYCMHHSLAKAALSFCNARPPPPHALQQPALPASPRASHLDGKVNILSSWFFLAKGLRLTKSVAVGLLPLA